MWQEMLLRKPDPLCTCERVWARDYSCKYQLVDAVRACSTLALFPGHRRNGLATSMSSNCYFHCQKIGSTNQNSERCHMTTVKHNWVMYWTDRNRAGIHALHDDCFSNDLYFTSVVEPTANSCFLEQESPILTAGKIVSHALIQYWLVEWDIAITVTLHLYTVWTRGSCQAISPTAWEQGFGNCRNCTAQGP